MPILAAPLVIPFAKAVPALAGIIGGIGMAALSNKVNEYIQDNPEESMKILSTIIPGVGIGEIFMKKGKDEEVEEEVSIEDMDPRDLTREEKAKEMKRRFKEGTGSKREIGRKGYEEVIQPGEDRTLEEADERYEGGIDDAPKPKFDYEKFFKRRRRADGGAIGIEVLFEEKKPRKNFFMGGPALEGQALNIYNSMNSYGFTDQQIADALQGQGLYTPSGSSTPETTTPNIIGSQINQGGGGGDGPPPGPTFNRNDLLGTTDYFPNPPLGHSLKMGLGSIVDFIKSGGIIGNTIRSFAKRFQKPRVELVNKINFDAVVREQERQKEVARQAAAEAAQQRDAAIASGLDAAIREGRDTSGFDRPDSGAYAEGAGMGVGGGYASDFGFKKGGLATMFTRKR